jgi:glycosyltransferase involved in cell wall biosynthesis
MEKDDVRVLIVITKGELGGAQTHVLELCQMLRRECEFRVMVGEPGNSPLGRELSAIGVPVDVVPGMSNESSIPAFMACVRQVAATARTWQADLIHVHSAVGALVGRLAGLMSGRQVVYTVHGFGFKPQVGAKRRWVVYWAERLLVRLTAKYICVSDAERQLAATLGVREGEVSVIANGLRDSQWRAEQEGAEPVLIMVARAVSPKRHDLLLHALAVMRDKGIVAPRTVFAGSGPLLPAVRALAEKFQLPGVSFLGDVDEVPRLLASSQIFALLSDHEGQPISVIEAMRAGLPIVASDLPGIRTQITDGVEGLLTANNPEAVAFSIERLMGDRQLRTRMAAAARRRYERDFSAATMAHAVMQVYGSLAVQPPYVVRPPVV